MNQIIYPQGFTCKCGGLKPAPGVAYGYAGKMCACANPVPQEFTTQISGSLINPNTLNQGWICPRCMAANSPSKDKCGC